MILSNHENQEDKMKQSIIYLKQSQRTQAYSLVRIYI